MTMNEPTIAQRIEHRRHEAHRCIRPGCGDSARAAYYVERPMRLAGRDLVPGDFVDLCWPHAHELYRAANDAVIEGYPSPEFWGPVPSGDPHIGLFDAYEDLPPRSSPLARFREWAPSDG